MNLKTNLNSQTLIPVLNKLTYLLLFCILLPANVVSEEVLVAKVNEKDGIFSIHLEMLIDGDEDDVYDLLTDYNQLTKLSDVIINSHIIEETFEHYILVLKSEGCVLFFCTTIHQTQKITELGEGYIKVEDIEGKSDFSYGKSMWHIRANEDGTLISYKAQLKPDFWLPPFFGGFIFKHRLLEESKNMVIRIEEQVNDDS